MQASVNQDREKYIGGSDIPIIMSLSPFKSRFDLLLEKAGYKLNTFEGNVYTEYGNTLEPKIRSYINRERKSKGLDPFKEGKHTREAEGDEIIGVRIHTDGEASDAILEVKTTSHIYDDVNDYKLYLVQLLYYMVLTGHNLGVLAVYERPDDLNERFTAKRLKLYNIDLADYDDLIKEIDREIEHFIEDLKKVKENPFITEESLLPIELPDLASRIVNLEDSIKNLKETEKKIDEYKEMLRRAMSAAGIKSFRTKVNGGYLITRVDDTEETTKLKFNEEKFKTDNEELYKRYLEPKTVKGRKGYLKITPNKEHEEV